MVPLAPEDTERLTLAELEGLERCDRVVFERPGHPLQDRLEARGVACDVWDDELEAGRAGWALVADPTSPRVLGLAHRGAAVSAGPAPALDTLTAAHGAPVVRAAAASLTGLVATMARLRSDDGLSLIHISEPTRPY